MHLAAGDASERVEAGEVFVDGELLAEAVLQGGGDSGGGFCVWHELTIVMPALVAGIHVFLIDTAKQDVDGRDKPGHDGG